MYTNEEDYGLLCSIQRDCDDDNIGMHDNITVDAAQLYVWARVFDMGNHFSNTVSR